MTTLDIIREHLKANGYDGLYNDVGECSCLLDDLCPCCECWSGYEPGYKGPDPYGECEFRIYATREQAEDAEADNA